MTTPVQPATPATRAVPAPRTAAPAAPAARTLGPVAGDSLALSATARATAGQKTVVIDGREFELREKGPRKRGALDKTVTYTLAAVGTYAGFVVGALMGPYMGGTIAGLLTIACATGLGGGAGFGAGRVLSAIGRKISGRD